MIPAYPTWVFLPATDPSDKRYGEPPREVGGRPAVVPQFDREVWYNEAVCAEVVRQLEAVPGPFVLAGFSKSALGAWHLTRLLPDRVAATVLFDGPVARQEPPPWNTADFFPDAASWQALLPINTVDDFLREVPADHRLVQVAGALFHAEMRELDLLLGQRGASRIFLAEPLRPHRWDSGWIEAAQQKLG